MIIATSVCFFFPPKRSKKRRHRVHPEGDGVVYEEDTFNLVQEAGADGPLGLSQGWIHRLKQFLRSLLCCHHSFCAICVRSSQHLDDASHASDIALNVERPIYINATDP